MSSHINTEEHDPVANLTMLPARSILKTSKSIDTGRLEKHQEMTSYSTTGMTRSASKHQKIPHFDEMNIIATYHPIDKDYGHMKIEEPKTPYAPNDDMYEEMDTEFDNDATTPSGVDADTLAQRLNESSIPSRVHIDRSPRSSIDENSAVFSKDLEHRKQFENHRKEHYNEFEVVRLRKKEIEAELRALEQEEAATGSEGNRSGAVSSSIDSIQSISGHSSSHHVHVKDDHQHDPDEQSLTPEERERKEQFELKRKTHYNEFRAAHLANKDDEK